MNKDPTSRLPRLKLNIINGQKRSYSLTNLARKKWFSEESLPSKILKKSFHRSKIPEPCLPDLNPQPVYRSLRTNFKSTESLPQDEDEMEMSVPNQTCHYIPPPRSFHPEIASAAVIEQMQNLHQNQQITDPNTEKCVVNIFSKPSAQFQKKESISASSRNVFLDMNRPHWIPAGSKTDRKNRSITNGPVERIRNCCRLMKQTTDKESKHRKTTKEKANFQIDQLKSNLMAQQEEILLLQEMLKVQQETNQEDDDCLPIKDTPKSMDFIQPKIRGETTSLGYHSMNSEYGKENELLRLELQESRDHSELLEFRILEFTEGIHRGTANSKSTRDQGTSMSIDETFIPEIPGSPEYFVPALGFRSQSESDRTFHYAEYQRILNELDKCVKPEKKSLVSHLNILLETVLPPSKWGKSDHTTIEDQSLYSDLTVIAARLQETLADPSSQEEIIQETIVKLRDFDASMSQLQSRVEMLTSENKNLQEALAVLHESHETRTEASGTESELVNPKTVQSDISDTESDELLSKGYDRYNRSSKMSETVNISTQTLAIEDEYETSDFQDDQIILTKNEHDSIIETQRDLQRDIEDLKIEKDMLAGHCRDLEVQLKIANSEICRDAAEVLRAEMGILEEKLATTERLKRQFFDEKCEIEEAENDSRLMAQRLESQLEAATEMESLLSASLSQEQKFAREFQSRVWELKSIDKNRRLHEERLEMENKSLRFREEYLYETMENESFAFYMILFGQLWRRMAALNRGAVMPYIFEPCHNNYCDIQWNMINDKWLNINELNICEPTIEYIKEKLISTAVQTDFQSTFDQIFGDNVMTTPSETNNNQIVDAISPLVLDDEISILQKKLVDTSSRLEEANANNTNLSHQQMDLQMALNDNRLEYQNHVKRLKNEINLTIDQYKKERTELQQSYDDNITELKRNSELHEQRFSALLQQYSILQQELATYLDDGTIDNTGNPRITTTKDLLSAIRELAKSEQIAKQKTKELEKKESAYQETISEADRIMSLHVKAYARQIEEMESDLEQKSLRIQQLEKSENTLRTAMKTSWKSGNSEKIAELHNRLIETENSELQLKQRVLNLERSGKELDIKFTEAESTQDNLKEKLKNHDDLIQRLRSLTSENNSLSLQLQKAHEAAMRASDIRQNEIFLKGRIEELEAAEFGLKTTLKDRDELIYQKDRKFRNKLLILEEEVTTLRSQADAKTTEISQIKKSESYSKKQIEDFEHQIISLEDDLGDASSRNKCDETQHRSEVARMRLQLKLVNTQLSELESYNGELKIKLTSAETSLNKMTNCFDENIQEHEKEIFSMNKQLEQNKSRLEESEANIEEQLNYGKIPEDLDYLQNSLIQLQMCLQKIIQESNICQKCSNENDFEALNKSLQFLTKYIHSQEVQTDSEFDDAEQIQNIDRKEVANSPSVPPRPRRDAKKMKCKIRLSIRNEGSILQELEETSSDLGLVHDYIYPTAQEVEDLEEAIRKCHAIITQKDEHLQLADLETNELHSRLIEEKTKLATKIDDANQSSKALTTLKDEQRSSVEKYENQIQNLQDKHGIELRALNQKMDLFMENLVKASENSRGKEKMVNALINQIRSNLRPEVIQRIINHLRALESNYNLSVVEIENVCHKLDKPVEECIDAQDVSDLQQKKQIVENFDRQNPSNGQKRIAPPPPPHVTSRIPRFRRRLSDPSLMFSDSSETGSQVFSRSMHRLYAESTKFLNKHATKAPCRCENEDKRSSLASTASAPPLRRKMARSYSFTSLDKKSSTINATSSGSVPKPKNLTLTRQVGVDGALIAWSPMEDECIAGFQVLVGGRVVQLIRTPQRTKALVTGLSFNAPFTIALVAISNEGLCSTPSLVAHKPQVRKEPKLKRSTSMPLNRNSTLPAFL